MNRAFVQRRPDRLVSPSATAADGLAKLGYEVVWFDQEPEFDRDTLVVGFIEVVRNAVRRITGNDLPIFNYPEFLNGHLGRKVWLETLGKIRNTPEMWPIFVKPAGQIKSFSGRLVHGVRNLIATKDLANDEQVWVSEPVQFISEWRCFVQNRGVIGCRHYRGDPLKFPDAKKILTMAYEWKEAPAAYCLDVGVVYEPTKEEREHEDRRRKGDLFYTDYMEHITWKKGTDETRLVEVNDAYSAGDYGLDPLLYARFLEARWCEMTGAKPIT